VADSHSFSGVVLSNGVVDLNFGAAGQVTNISVRIGEHVKAGQVLASEVGMSTMAVVTADEAAITADRAALTQIADQAAPGAAALAEAQAKLASDRARLAVEQAQVVKMQLQAPMNGTIVAVNGQVGEQVTAVGGRAGAAQPQGSTSVSLPPGSQPTATAATTSAPVIALRISRTWQVDIVVPVGSTSAIKPGERVTVAVPDAGLRGVRGEVAGVMSAPVRTGQGLGYQALVTVLGPQPAPPVSGLAADVRLGSLSRPTVTQVPAGQELS
jgi:macrolide-specific efflux system membrane fusion protein